MKQGLFTVAVNAAIAENTWQLELLGDTSGIEGPGQFVNAAVENGFLRRPLSVCDYQPGRLTLIYKAVGAGTAWLSAQKPGKTLDLLTGLGNGYELSAAGPSPLLVGGGVGTAPLYALAKALLGLGKRPAVVLGFNKAPEVFLAEAFAALGLDVTVVTLDGSRGQTGFVTDALPEACSYFYACGPEPMLRALYHKTTTSGQFSLEARMGCGFGACMGCTLETANGYKRICRDGPVFRKEALLWRS